jgi:subtilisin-like proprotein convertase family protein
MKKRVLFITMLLMAAMLFTSVLLAESGPTLHLVERGGNSGGGCFVQATGVGTSIPDNVPAGVCFQATASGPAGATVDNVTVDVAAAHSWIGDLTFSINSPDGSSVSMMDRPGHPLVNASFGDNDDLAVSSPISFTDASADAAEDMGDGSTATNIVVCQADGICDYAPDDALSALVDENANGTWEFCVSDNAGGDTGSISSFTFNIACTGLIPDLVFTKTVGLDPNACATTDSITIPAGQGGTMVTYCYDMTNTGTVTFDLHTVVDDQEGTVLGPNFPANVPPGTGAMVTVSVLLTQTTVNSATWTATDAQGANGVSASDTATVTQGSPTDVSLSAFSSDPAAASPIWLAALFAVILGFGFIIRRRMIRAE